MRKSLRGDGSQVYRLVTTYSEQDMALIMMEMEVVRAQSFGLNNESSRYTLTRLYPNLKLRALNINITGTGLPTFLPTQLHTCIEPAVM